MTMTLTLQQSADFSAMAYQPLNTPLPSSYANDGWVALELENHNYGSNGYFGRAFVKLVIAHRGTEPTDEGDLFSDLQLSLDIAANQLADANILSSSQDIRN